MTSLFFWVPPTFLVQRQSWRQQSTSECGQSRHSQRIVIFCFDLPGTTWSTDTRSLLLFCLNKNSLYAWNYEENVPWKYCKTSEQPFVTCRKLWLRQTIDMQKPGRKSWQREFLWEIREFQTPTHIREFRKLHTNPEPDICWKNTWENP